MRRRCEQYLRALNTLPNSDSTQLGDLLLALPTLSLQDIKTDFRVLSISIKANSFLTEQAKWRIRNYLEQNKQEDFEVLVSRTSLKEITASFEDITESSVTKALLREKAWHLLEKYPRDTLLSMSQLPEGEIAFKHQIETVTGLFDDLDDRGLVADEVGLGKTVTALLWLHEHVLRSDRPLTALVLVPSNLKGQWSDAFFQFFGLAFVSDTRPTTTELEMQDILLLSVDEAKMGDTEKVLIKRYWDCLILDESHDVKNMSSLRFKFLYAINASYKLLLSATPVHNTAYDLYSQVLLLHPGLLGKRRQFGDYYLEDKKRVKNPLGLQRMLERVLMRTRRSDIPFEFSERHIKTEFIPEWTEHEYGLYDDLLGILVGVFHKQLPRAVMLSRASGGETAVADFVLKCMLLLREMASHPDAALKTTEESLYPKILEYAKATGDDTYTKQLELFLGKYKDQTLHLSKENRLLEILAQLFKAPDRRVIVFVNFLKTQDAIRETILRRFADIDVQEYYGDLPKRKKKSTIRLFSHSKRCVLVSTDSGGQGLNLDAADAVINYDYPWNPMKVEQRVGRIDRLSKRHDDIYVFNLITKGTIEQYVYQTLIEKIGIVKDVIGDIMSPIEIEEEWERRFMVSIGLIVLSCENSSELKDKFEKLDKTSLLRVATQYSTLIHEKHRHVLA